MSRLRKRRETCLPHTFIPLWSSKSLYQASPVPNVLTRQEEQEHTVRRGLHARRGEEMQFGSSTVTNEPHRAHTVETYFTFFNTLTPDRGRTLMKFQRYGLADIYFAESNGAAM